MSRSEGQIKQSTVYYKGAVFCQKQDRVSARWSYQLWDGSLGAGVWKGRRRHGNQHLEELPWGPPWPQHLRNNGNVSLLLTKHNANCRDLCTWKSSASGSSLWCSKQFCMSCFSLCPSENLAYFLINFHFFIYFPFNTEHEIHYFQAFILNASSPFKAWPTLTFACIA